MELDNSTPVDIYGRIREKYTANSFLLESIEGPERLAKHSFIGFDSVFDIKAKGNEIQYNGKRKTVENSYEYLRKKFYEFDAGTIDFLPFSSGMVGYFSYDIVRFFESLPDSTEDTLNLPDYHFMIPAQILCFNHIDKKTYLISHKRNENVTDLFKPDSAMVVDLKVDSVESNTVKDDFQRSIAKVKRSISQGEVYQVVLSRRNRARFRGDQLNIYRRLRNINPSPYLFFLDFGETNLIGSSPEMLVKVKDKKLTTRPLAGTRKRSMDPEIDERYKINMLLDEKERAEHLMLVDLHRNDMGKVSEYGSVKVDELMGVEKYSHVQHMVSNVTANLRKDKDCFDVFKACFPAGTVTGAPKIRAMEIIDELEVERRGPYGGAVGYFDFSGNMEFAITIRSIFTKDDVAYVQAGAGIVEDSVAEKEFMETENKMRAMIKALEVE
ncbi:MAG: anthranilate synthase component I family protein [Thermoplasmata archaeon]